jgi:hypothetical protein
LGDFLGRLGKDADEVAASLMSIGVLGVPGAVRFLNPIVQFAAHALRADARQIDVIQKGRLTVKRGDGTTTAYVLSEAVIDFLEGFNRGRFPELISR